MSIGINRYVIYGIEYLIIKKAIHEFYEGFFVLQSAIFYYSGLIHADGIKFKTQW